MLGLQGGSSSPKVYRCVACSATFTGLASLLVHQATHASTVSKVSSPPPAQSSISPHETLLANSDSNSAHHSPPAVLPESPSPSFYICDCGEEFQDFDLMLEHKRSHLSQMQQQQPLADNIVLPSGTGCDSVFPSPHASFSPVTQTGLVLSRPSTSQSPDAVDPTLNALKGDVALEDRVALETTPQGQRTLPQDIGEKRLENISTTGEQISDTVEDVHFQETKDSVHHSAKSENLPKNNTLMKMLASAYLNRFPRPPSEIQSDNVVPKQENVPVDITPKAKAKADADASPINDLSVAQLRRLLAKPGIKTKAPSISKILESSKKRVVSLTKTFSPVVVLETRQKLMDSVSKGTYGRYQCGRCRRVFENLDRLTEHHFLHKKERIKCCRRCKQLIIGRLPLPDNHICPQMGNKNVHSSGSLKHKFSFAPKIVPFHSVNNAKKVFYCPLCRHSYARRWNLKTHRCHGQMSAISKQFTPSMQKFFTQRPNSDAKTDTDEDENGCHDSKSIAVGTEVTGRIKVELASSNAEQSVVSQLAWTPPAKTFSPFSLKSSIIEEHQDPSLLSYQEGEENSWHDEEPENEDSNEGQWTMPLDDEMQVLSTGDDDEVNESDPAEHADMAAHGLHYFVSDGVRRYPCDRCQKTYSRASTLRRHLRLCGFRPPGIVTAARSDDQGGSTLNASNEKAMFPCFVCGKIFNRKDNMMVHRKRCQLLRTMPDVDSVTAQQSVPGTAAADSQTQEDGARNWGIMSLPSVLPRRVTCECGAGFTSPRLLLEHLQKHAQESYTCPTCGETVNSWAEYEVHLQIHMHPHRPILKGVQPQRAQPLLLRFQQQQQQLQSVLRPPQKQPHPVPLPAPTKKRIVCTRCGNSFATRCSLRRHISWNRCKGVRAANPATNPATNPPKAFRCSHCSADFPNSISLIFHQRNGACKPAIKPVRCPVCLRWFGTFDSLQKHLLTHKQSESYRCDVCQGTYPSLKSLKNHRRRIHRIMAGDTQPKTQEPLTP
ncbi:uncharacterized protein PAE49_005579 isoform 2-T3 [Odontesthes bonariensis]